MVMPVKWRVARPVDEAFWENGLTAYKRHTACKLRDIHTIETVESAFGLNEARCEVPAATARQRS